MDRKIIRVGIALLAVASLLPAPVIAQDQKVSDQAAQGAAAGSTRLRRPRPRAPFRRERWT